MHEGLGIMSSREGVTMKKLTFSLIGFAFLLCAFTAQAAAGIAISVPSVGEACTNDTSCAAGETCVADVCVECVVDGDCAAGEECVAGACEIPPECTVDGDCAAGEECVAGECVEIPPECTVDGDCAAGEECVAGECVEIPPECSVDGDCAAGEECVAGECVEIPPECVVDADCAAGEECVAGECVEIPPECTVDADCGDGFCDTDSGSCVECLDDLDCAEGELCELGECIEESICNLFIRPPKLNLKKGVRPIKQMFTIKGVKGEEGFDPDTTEIDFSPCEVVESFVAGDSDVLKVRIIVPANATFEGDFLDVQVGDCAGQVFLKKPNAKQLLKEQRKQEKLALKEQKRLEEEAIKASKKAAK